MFTNASFEEVYESEHACTASKKLREILYAKYKKSYSHKVMENQCQHLTTTNLMNYYKYLKKSKSFSVEHLAPGKQIN